MKIWIFRAQFKLTTRETNGAQEICLFGIRVYLEAWFTATCPCSAPFQDLRFLKAIQQYPNQNISNIAMKKILGHLWYLSEELAALAFLDVIFQLLKNVKWSRLWIMNNMRVANGIAERGVALIEEYNELHTTDKEQ